MLENGQKIYDSSVYSSNNHDDGVEVVPLFDFPVLSVTILKYENSETAKRVYEIETQSANRIIFEGIKISYKESDLGKDKAVTHPPGVFITYTFQSNNFILFFFGVNHVCKDILRKTIKTYLVR